MADVTYDVQVRFFSTGSIDSGIGKAKSKSDEWLRGMGDGMQKLSSSFNSMFDSAASSIAGAFTTAAAGISAAVAGAVALGIKEGFNFNNESEQAIIGFGTQLAAGDVGRLPGDTEMDNFNNGIRLAQLSVAQMRKDASALPGEFKDLRGIAMSVANPLSQMGYDHNTIEDIAKKTMVAAAASGGRVQMRTAGNEMAMLLHGSAKHNLPLMQLLALGDAKAFNKLSERERFKKIQESLSKRYMAEGTYSKSWDAIKTTALDNMRSLVGGAVNPLFENVKSRLTSLNGEKFQRLWSIASKDAEKIGNWMSRAFDSAMNTGMEIYRTWMPAVMNFGSQLYNGVKRAFEQVGPIFGQIGATVRAFMNDPDALGKLEGMLGKLVALRVGSGVMGMAGSGISSMASSGMGVAAMAEVAIPAAVALGAVALAAEGAVHAMTDSQSQYHEEALAMGYLTETSITNLIHNFGELDNATRPFRDSMGVTLVAVVGIAAEALNMLVVAATAAANAWDTIMNKMPKDAGSWIREKLGYMHEDNNGQFVIDRSKDFAELTESQMSIYQKAMDTGLTVEKMKEAKPPSSTTHIHKVEIRVEGNEDPDRVAKVVYNKLIDMGKNPTTSAGGPNSMVNRGRSNY